MALDRDRIARPRAVPARRRLGGRAARPDGAALSSAARSSIRPSSARPRRFTRCCATRSRVRHHRGRHDLRHRQQGPRSVGRLDLRPGRRRLRQALRAELSRSRHRPVGDPLPAARRGDRPDQRRPGHHPEGAGLHRHADDAVHRPRLRARAHRTARRSTIPTRRRNIRCFFQLGETNVLGFNNQIAIFVVVAVVGAYVLAKTRWGYETFATGGNEQAAIYAGIPTRLGAHPRLPDLVALRDARRR